MAAVLGTWAVRSPGLTHRTPGAQNSVGTRLGGGLHRARAAWMEEVTPSLPGQWL